MASGDDLDLPPGIDLPGRREPAAAAAAAPVLPRCWPDVDAAPTAGDRRGDAWICLAWANGSCRAGASCESLHRLPSMAEEQRLVYSTDGIDRDVFGRMGHGTQATAILVRGLPPTAGSQRQIRAALDEFGEWGKVVRTWVHHEPGCGYVAFKARGTAQFVMEAMQGRSLSPEGGEPLQLSWALRDPGQEQAEQVHSIGTACPRAPPRVPYTPARLHAYGPCTALPQARNLAMRSMEEARERRDEQHEMYRRLEAEGLALKRQKLHGGGGSGGGGGGSGGGGGGGGSGGGGSGGGAGSAGCDDAAALEPWSRWVEEPEVTMTAVTALYPGGVVAVNETRESEGVGDGSSANGTAAACLPAGWSSEVDPRYGARYYVHADSGRTQWEHPSGSHE